VPRAARAAATWYAAVVCLVWSCALPRATWAEPRPPSGDAALSAAASAAATTSPLARATQCYASGMLGCVVDVLGSAEPTPDEAAEHLRLLAFAYARLDRFAEARAVFARWIALSPSHRVEQSAVPPAVFNAYSAARLDALRDKLDLQPKVGAAAVPLPASATAGDLLRVPAPPRSARDDGRDVLVAFDAFFAYGLAGAPPFFGGGVELALCGDGCGRSIGLYARGGPLVGPLAPEDVGGGGMLASVGLHGGWRPLSAASLELALDLGGGFGGRDGAVSGGYAVIAAAIRYAPLPEGPVGWRIGLQPQLALGGEASRMMVGLTIGLVLRPGPTQAARDGE
jgi:hypothetical protein